MIRRFLYHGFWNFYDYLGTYTFLGAAHVGAVLALFFTLSWAVGLPVVAKLSLLALVAAALWALVAAGFAGFFPFAWKAAQDLPARFPDVRVGMRRYFRRYLFISFFLGLIVAVIGANVRFYLWLGGEFSGSRVALACTIIAAAFGWALLAFVGYATSVLINVAVAESTAPLKPVLKRAFVSMAIAPGFWCFVLVFWLAVAALCVLSHAGIILILPGLASASATAHRITSQHGVFLAEAREHIGTGQRISAYQKKALELAEEWEARQPRRTFRELLKPWEY